MQLGIQFYQQSDFERAAELLEGVLETDPTNGTAYGYLFNSYIQLNQFEKAEKLAQGMSKRDPGQVMYAVDVAFALRKQGKESKAVGQYDAFIKKLLPNRGQIITLSNAFRSKAEYDYAILCYQKGRQLLGEPMAFSIELAELYYATGQKSKLVDAYLDYLAAAPQQLGYVQNMLQSRLDEADYELLRAALLSSIQKRPDDIMLSELMIWFFVQQRDFQQAFYQARAIDRRMQENGNRILTLSRAAVENKDYAAAIEMLQYLIDKGPNYMVYYDARYEILEAERMRLQGKMAVEADWRALAAKYVGYIDAFPQQRNILQMKQRLAAIYGYELKRFEEAVALLEGAIAQGGDRRLLAEAKLELGDLYLLTDELWEAALTYGQVDKDFPNDPLGQEAKFRNARLSFYKGEFEWSQAQLDVLKASTSQRISNDALALSLLITDNLDLDTTILPMKAFAGAELLMFRKEYVQAHAAFEELLRAYPGHGLSDEVWFRQAEMYTKQGAYGKAAEKYEAILKDFGQDILGDDALFLLAVLYQEYLQDSPKAMALFQDLLIKYPDSTFTFEARRRYRLLRGDKIN
ncbi:MAG: tetratricopeptide repeat protein [Sphingobacteriaceae bacterium]|nr:tetratricopeptide repeat protein [Sphingobacteriaceae bacterium]